MPADDVLKTKITMGWISAILGGAVAVAIGTAVVLTALHSVSKRAEAAARAAQAAAEKRSKEQVSIAVQAAVQARRMHETSSVAHPKLRETLKDLRQDLRTLLWRTRRKGEPPQTWQRRGKR